MICITVRESFANQKSVLDCEKVSYYYSYFKYVEFVVKVEKRCVKSIIKAYQTFKTKINNKIISIRRRQREGYLKKLQKKITSQVGKNPGCKRLAETSSSKDSKQCL